MRDDFGDQDLSCLVYVSRAADTLLPRFQPEMDAIVAASHRDNTARRVTGILVAHHAWFIQALEGERAEILTLYRKIAADPRHQQVQMVALEPIAARRFGEWGMCAGRPPAALADDLTTLSSAELISLLETSMPPATGAAPIRASDLLDVLPEQQFDDLAEVARSLARSRGAAIWLTDGARRWLKACSGLKAGEVEVDAAVFARALAEPDGLWLSDDGAEGGLRFKAAAALEAGSRRIGVLAVMDEQPRPYDPALASALSVLARAIASRLASQAEERIAARLLGSATDAIVSIGDDLAISYLNPAAEKLFGRRAADVVGRSLSVIFPDWTRDAALSELARRMQGASEAAQPGDGEALELTGQHADGATFPMELTLAAWREGEREAAGVIIRDVSRRKAAEAALRAAKAAAETANTAKTAFLANMSHEIRTPLNGIVGVAGVLADSGLGPAQAEMAGLIRTCGDELQRLLGDILDIARIEAGATEVAHEAFSVPDVARSVIALHAAAAKEKRLDLVLEIEPAAEREAIGDPEKLRQILGALVSNAVKFTEAGSVILSVAPDAGQACRFAVRDTGVGFDPALKAELFARFHQADGSLTRRFGGMGLGLSLCRQLVELLGGEIDCDSRPGEGAVFEVRLPLEWAAEISVAPQGDSEQPAGEDAPLAVLVADDNATNRRVVELILGGLDVEVVSVEDGALALEAFKSRRFDVVLMDMMMPVMDGLSATRGIRTLEQAAGAPPTPVLMLSANTLPEHMEAARVAGVDRYLTKPITAPLLIGAIDDALTWGAAAA